jgi:hypothetical protein
MDRLLWVWFYRLWPRCLDTMVLVKPATVVQWHRQGFRLFWRWRPRSGRPSLDREIRKLIREMSSANPIWGAPRIHGELLMLGIEVAQSTVARYMTRRQGPPSHGWKTFLRNHAAGIASIDLFVVRTISFKLLYGLVILRHARRRLVSIKVTHNPTAEWIAGQVTDTFPWDEAPRYLIRDREGASVQRIPAAFAQCGSGITRLLHVRRGRTGTLSGSSDRSGANPSTTSSCSARRTCAASSRLTLRTTTRSGHISHWVKMRQSSGGSRRSAASLRYRSSAGSIINTLGFKFWIGTGDREAAQRRDAAPPILSWNLPRSSSPCSSRSVQQNSPYMHRPRNILDRRADYLVQAPLWLRDPPPWSQKAGHG